MLGVGFEFHVFTLLGGKKKTTTKKPPFSIPPKSDSYREDSFTLKALKSPHFRFMFSETQAETEGLRGEGWSPAEQC